MRCGKCKADGVTVDHVKSCYQSDIVAKDVSKVVCGIHIEDGVAEKDNAAPMWPASDAQIKYVVGLQEERILPEGWINKTPYALERMERDQVSGLITVLKTFPKADKEPVKSYDFPAGRYAIDTGEWPEKALGLNPIRFIQVDKPTEGRWKGYTFVKELIGAPGDFRKENVRSASVRNRYLNAIAQDPREASIRFGKEVGSCGVCGSPLTNEESRKYGIGPICRGKTGW